MTNDRFIVSKAEAAGLSCIYSTISPCSKNVYNVHEYGVMGWCSALKNSDFFKWKSRWVTIQQYLVAELLIHGMAQYSHVSSPLPHVPSCYVVYFMYLDDCLCRGCNTSINLYTQSRCRTQIFVEIQAWIRCRWIGILCHNCWGLQQGGINLDLALAGGIDVDDRDRWPLNLTKTLDQLFLLNLCIHTGTG